MHDPRDFFLLPHHTDASVVDGKEITLPLSGTLTEEEFPRKRLEVGVCGRNLELHRVH